MAEGVKIHFDPPVPAGYVDCSQVLKDLRHFECRSCGALVLEISVEIHEGWHRTMQRMFAAASFQRSRAW